MSQESDQSGGGEWLAARRSRIGLAKGMKLGSDGVHGSILRGGTADGKSKVKTQKVNGTRIKWCMNLPFSIS